MNLRVLTNLLGLQHYFLRFIKYFSLDKSRSNNCRLSILELTRKSESQTQFLVRELTSFNFNYNNLIQIINCTFQLCFKSSSAIHSVINKLKC